MSELKPCPFCGSEASLVWMDDEELDLCWVECGRCGASTVFCGQPELAIDAWNTRAERTCHVVKNSRKYVLSDGTELFDDGCSICNGYIGAGENYCSQCGAKVVE